MCIVFSVLECMGQDCDILVPEDFALNVLTNPRLRTKYQEYMFSDHVKVSSHFAFLLKDNVTWFLGSQIFLRKM